MTMGLEDDGDPTTGNTGAVTDTAAVGMDLEEISEAVAGQSARKPGSSSLQTEAAKISGNNTRGMQKIDEVDEEEEEDEILGMKTRSWRKINLSFEVELQGEEISNPGVQSEHEPMKGSNEPMSHHPIMSKIANFIVAMEKRCKTVKVMSSKEKLVLDTKVCMDSWSINKFKEFFAYSIVKNRKRNVQVTLHIDYGLTQSLWKLKHLLINILKSEGIWIINHNGPVDVVETTQIGFLAKFHPELYRMGFQNDVNKRIDEFIINNKSEMILRAHAIPELKDWLGDSLPEIQIIPLSIPGTSKGKGRNPKVQAVGISVPSKYRSLFRYIITSVCFEMGFDYVDFSMKYDDQRKVTYNKLIRIHQEFMFNHKTINVHQLERKEMETCITALEGIPSVIAVDETVITERNGTWVLIMRWNPDTGFVQNDLDKIDSIIDNIPPMSGRKLSHAPFRKRQPSECMNRDALSLQENRYKDFTATPFGSSDTWSARLFPPRNITTQKGGRSTKTTISIDDETVATLTDTVAQLQRNIQRITTDLSNTKKTMKTMDDRLTNEETRGGEQSTLIKYLEDSQLLTAQTMSGQMELAREEAKEDREKANTKMEQVLTAIAISKDDNDRMMQSMLQQLLNNTINNNANTVTPLPAQTNITNNNTGHGQQQIYGGGTESQATVFNNGNTAHPSPKANDKRKQIDKTPSTTLEEQDTASPERRKQKQKQNGTVPNEINFDKFINTDDEEMDIQDHYESLQEQQQDADDVEMENQYGNDDHHTTNNETGVGYIGSADSFASRDENSEDTIQVSEEEQTITDHNFNNVIDEMDYTHTTAPTTTTAMTDDGFTAVHNGASPNRTAIRQRQHENFNTNPYSALESPRNESSTMNNNNNNNNNDINKNNTSAKTDKDPRND